MAGTGWRGGKGRTGEKGGKGWTGGTREGYVGAGFSRP